MPPYARPALRRVAVIGFGAIGRVVIQGLLQGNVVNPAPDCVVLVRSSSMAASRVALDAIGGHQVALVESLAELVAFAPDVVVEAAGQPAIHAMAETILGAGLDLMVVSTGALADDALRARLLAVSQAKGARLLIPAGAIAGLDGLGALKLSGDLSVRYTSTKPPAAWRGTPAESMIDLGAVTTATTFYSGPASEAAQLFPKNANLAATVAMAGAGFAATTIALVADPHASGNCGRIEASAKAGQLTVELAGPSMPDNPKTSLVTAYSLLNALAMRDRVIVI
jgi:aspartate dehydrogenase